MYYIKHQGIPKVIKMHYLGTIQYFVPTHHVDVEILLWISENFRGKSGDHQSLPSKSHPLGIII